MTCIHKWKVFQTEFTDSGYMVIKFCEKCHYTAGSGFLDKDHEINYLNSLIDNPQT